MTSMLKIVNFKSHELSFADNMVDVNLLQIVRYSTGFWEMSNNICWSIYDLNLVLQVLKLLCLMYENIAHVYSDIIFDSL